jgi:glycosyltransferase involved in cell wall biosynthesis
LRWAVNAVITAARLAQARPRTIIVTNPPIVAPLVVWCYAQAFGATMLLDSHPGGFGAQGDRVAARVQRLHAWLARHAAAVLVTSPQWVVEVERWGGRALVVHEAAPTWHVRPAGPITGRPQVLYVGTFGGDEPVGDVLEAARLAPELDLLVTGDPRKAPLAARVSPPQNVRFVGYLGPDAYLRAIEGADVVVSLTTEPTSVMRSAAEAVWAGRPLVVSDFPGLAAVFPHAIRAAPGGAALASALRTAVARHAQLCLQAPVARAGQAGRWELQRAALESALSDHGQPPVVPEVPSRPPVHLSAQEDCP